MEPEPGLYGIDPRRARARELWRFSPNAPSALVTLLVVKVFRVKLGGGKPTHRYPVPLVPRDPAALPSEALKTFNEAEAAWTPHGYTRCCAYALENPAGATEIVGAAWLHEDRRAIGQTTWIAADPQPGIAKASSWIVSYGAVGKRYATTSVPARFDIPPDLVQQTLVRAPIDQLAPAHAGFAIPREQMRALEPAEVLPMVERDENGFIELMIRRGVLKRVEAR